MKPVIYARVCTNQQDTTNQTEVLLDWAKQRDFEVIKVYQEEETAWKAGHQSYRFCPQSSFRNYAYGEISTC